MEAPSSAEPGSTWVAPGRGTLPLLLCPPLELAAPVATAPTPAPAPMPDAASEADSLVPSTSLAVASGSVSTPLPGRRSEKRLMPPGDGDWRALRAA